MRIVNVAANFRTGHFLNTNHRRSRKEDNIKMHLAEIVCNGLDWIVQWRTSVKKIMNFLVIWKQEISWPGWETVQNVLPTWRVARLCGLFFLFSCSITYSILKITAFGVVTGLHLVDTYRRFGGMCYLLLQGRWSPSFLNMETTRSTETSIPIKQTTALLVPEIHLHSDCREDLKYHSFCTMHLVTDLWWPEIYGFSHKWLHWLMYFLFLGPGLIAGIWYLPVDLGLE
jgi:hypothetical protein